MLLLLLQRLRLKHDDDDGGGAGADDNSIGFYERAVLTTEVPIIRPAQKYVQHKSSIYTHKRKMLNRRKENNMAEV